MDLSEAIALCVKHHPAPYRQLRHYYRTKINFAYMRGDIQVTFTEDDNGKLVGDYDRDSFMRWLRSKPVAVYLDTDVKLALDGRTRDEVNQYVNQIIRDSLLK